MSFDPNVEDILSWKCDLCVDGEIAFCWKPAPVCDIHLWHAMTQVADPPRLEIVK